MEYEHSGMIKDAAVWAIERIRAKFESTLGSYTEPSILYRPKIFKDGDRWCCLYGDNIQEGIAGWGDTPYRACCEFDTIWLLGDGNSSRKPD